MLDVVLGVRRASLAELDKQDVTPLVAVGLAASAYRAVMLVGDAGVVGALTA